MALSILLAYLISYIRAEISEHLLILAIFVFSFIIVAIFWGVPEINPDAANFFRFSKYIHTYGLIVFLNDYGSLQVPAMYNLTVGPIAFGTNNLIVGPVAFGTIFRLFGDSRGNILVFNTILFSFAALNTYFIGKKLWNREVGFYASLLLVTFPFLISQVPLLLVDTLTMFFVSLAILAYIVALESKTKLGIIFAVVSIFLATYSKPYAALALIGTLPTISILLYSETKKSKRARAIVRRTIATLILSSIPIFLFFIFKYDFLSKMIYGLIIVTPLIQYSSWGSDRTTALFYQLGPITVLLSIMASIIALRKKDRHFLILATWIIIPLLVLFNTRIRYLIFIFPAIAIAASISINTIRKEAIRKYLLASLVLTSLVVSVFVFLPHMMNITEVNLKYAAEYTNSKKDVEDIAVFTNFPSTVSGQASVSLAYLFDYYSSKDITWYDYNDFSSFNEFPDAIVIISEKLLTIENENMNDILNTNYNLSRVFNFGKVGVWSPCITSVYTKSSYFIVNFDSAIKFALDENGHEMDLNASTLRSMMQLTTYKYGNVKSPAILLHPPTIGGSYLLYHDVYLPSNTSLLGGIALDPRVWGPEKGDGVTFKILIQLDNDTTVEFSTYIDPKSNIHERGVNTFSIDLSKYSNKIVSILFVTEPGKNSVYDWALWIDPRIATE